MIVIAMMIFDADGNSNLFKETWGTNCICGVPSTFSTILVGGFGRMCLFDQVERSPWRH
jgi:hypothetical protein